MPKPKDIGNPAAIPVYRAKNLTRGTLANDSLTVSMEAHDEMGDEFHVEFNSDDLGGLLQTLSQLWTMANHNRNDGISFFEVTDAQAFGVETHIGIGISFGLKGIIHLRLNEGTARILYEQLGVQIERMCRRPEAATLN